MTGHDPELHRVAEPSLSVSEGRRRMEAARTSRSGVPVGETVGATELARRLGLSSRQTVHDRVARGELVSFDIAGKHRFPTAQFDERGRVSPGIAEVLKAFEPLGDAFAARGRLTRSNFGLDGDAPLQRLRDGGSRGLAAVTAAAAAELDGSYR